MDRILEKQVINFRILGYRKVGLMMANFKENTFPELRAEMARRGLNNKMLSEWICVSEDTFRRKLNGESEFKVREARIICDRFELSMDVLFKTNKE